ncbi:respiratory nitrate reductase subunit gamma [Mycobacterium tuberculosis]|uniref:respiratory nitrate reductase subunit gamma n=1 Tax=Mycobacterium tuberculosis TaxID=1773 RepID=UPI0034CF6D05
MAVLDLVEIFWDAAPYVVVAIAVVGTWWRYRYDKFGWTTRSSQLYESRLLSIGSPMFHFGSLLVIMGHVMGLFIPDSWTRAFGMSDHLYHLQALLLGAPAGFATLLGIGLLIYRRRIQTPVWLATTRNDKLMYLVLVCAIVAGLACTLMGATHEGDMHDYRRSVSVWFRSIWMLAPRGDLMAQATLYYQAHVLIALALFALWPFTRLVHAFSAPIAYLFRPYIVYRSREVAAKHELIGSAPRRRGW